MDEHFCGKVAAAAIVELTHHQNPKKKDLDIIDIQKVCSQFFDIDGINSNILIKFDEYFPDKMTYEQLQLFMVEYLRPSSAKYNMIDLVDATVKHCWNVLENSMSSQYISKELVFDMWTIFLRLAGTEKYPLTTDPNNYKYILKPMFKAIYLTKLNQPDISTPLTFKEMLHAIDSKILKNLNETQLGEILASITKNKEFFVDFVYYTGYLYKRTKRNANWTGWRNRFCKLSQEKLEYFEDDSCKVKKGEVPFYKTSSISDLGSTRSTFFQKNFKFSIMNGKDYTLELSADGTEDKKQWLTILSQVLSTVKNGTTLVKELTKSLPNSENGKEIQKDNDKDNGKVKKPGMPENIPKGPTKEPSGEPISSDIYDEYKNKIKAIFLELDTDGNGFIEFDEFKVFLSNLGIEVPHDHIEKIFNDIDIDKNGRLCLTEFDEYFLNSVDGFVTGQKIPESFLLMAFTEADREGKGAINFKDFMDYVLEKNQDVKAKQIITCFKSSTDIVDGGEDLIGYEGFKVWLNKQDINMLFDGDCVSQLKVQNAMLDLSKNLEGGTLQKHLLARWDAFKSFKRLGTKGELVMSGAHGMVDDVLPGSYSLLDLAAFSDLPPLRPKFAEAKVEWIPDAPHGKLIFPSNFDGKIPVERATEPFLRYYGCNFAEGAALEVSLLYRHGIQDFTYENSYMDKYVLAQSKMGGSGIERHEFAHLDCPLVEDNGIFILAKIENDIMHVTGFKVPRRHTLYVPSFTIHSNDYLKGTWRTMLSDETPIDHVRLYKQKDFAHDNIETITFQFIE